MFIRRELEAAIRSGAAQVPVVAIIGPRQSGKSTLAQELFSKHRYLDMQDAEMFEFANNDPKGLLKSYKNEYGIIIDEAQYAPHLCAQIKVEADKDQRPGYFILSGSQKFMLHEKISESLADRVYVYTLLPFSCYELANAGKLLALPPEQISKGFYPRVYQPHIDHRDYYVNYISTYVERDIRTIKNIDNILLFKKFIKLCALRIGSTINYTDLANDCAISVATARSWLALLETSFILFLLPPYHTNLGRRSVKSPKLYFYDVGLAATIIGLDTEMLLKTRDIYGALFENMVIVDLIKNYHARNEHPVLSFFRDSNQREIDLIVEQGSAITAIEIKASQTVTSDFFTKLTWFGQQHSQIVTPIVVYGGDDTQQRSSGHVIPWNALKQLIT
jgi:uncharacterized protein